MTSAIVNYFTSHNVRVMLSAGGATYTSFWDQALSTNATQLGINAAKLAKAMGVGIEIDYENDASPNLAGLQEFISAYRSLLSYDPTGANPAAPLDEPQIREPQIRSPSAPVCRLAYSCPLRQSLAL